MSVQMPLFAPATRVASRKLGPTRGSGSSSRSTVRAACETSTLASTCGRWLTAAGGGACETGAGGAGGGPRGGGARARAEGQQEAVQAFVEDTARAGARCQVPGGALEQVDARVLDARGLRA